MYLTFYSLNLTAAVCSKTWEKSKPQAYFTTLINVNTLLILETLASLYYKAQPLQGQLAYNK